jgi:hypothetical protein
MVRKSQIEDAYEWRRMLAERPDLAELVARGEEDYRRAIVLARRRSAVMDAHRILDRLARRLDAGLVAGHLEAARRDAASLVARLQEVEP